MSVVAAGIHWPRTLVARRNSQLQRKHLNFKPLPRQASVLHCVLLDCSASMMGAGQLSAAKGLLLELSQQVYCRRDALAVISFAGDSVQLLHDPHRASASALDWVEPIAGGGGSPVQLAVQWAEQLLQRQARRYPERHRVLWLLGDGRYEPLPSLPRHVNECHVVDYESSYLKLGRVKRLAKLWRAQYTTAATFSE